MATIEIAPVDTPQDLMAKINHGSFQLRLDSGPFNLKAVVFVYWSDGDSDKRHQRRATMSVAGSESRILSEQRYKSSTKRISDFAPHFGFFFSALLTARSATFSKL